MLFLDALLSMSYQNIIVYFVWIAVIMGFLVNIALIIDKTFMSYLKPIEITKLNLQWL